MPHRIRHILYLFPFLLSAVSCVYPYDDLPAGGEEIVPVFDGNIVVGDRATLSFSWMQDLDGHYPSVYKEDVPFSWWVEDDEGETYRPLPGEDFVSLSGSPEDRAYRIQASLNGESYQSEWQKALAAPEITDISFSADDTKVYVLVSLKEGSEATGYVALSYDETWEFHVEWLPVYVVDPDTWVIFPQMNGDVFNHYCWTSESHAKETILNMSRTGGVAKQYPLQQFQRRDSRNHRKYSVLVKARTISQEEYEYQNNLQQNEQGGNNLFRPNPGEMTGNMRCSSNPSQRVLGSVSLSSAATMRAFLDSRYQISVTPSDAQLRVPLPGEYAKYYYDYEYRPVKDVLLDGNNAIGWAPLRCVDCVVAGGTLERPDYWQ